MKASYLTKENKITLYANPEYRGADIPDSYMKRSKDMDIPVDMLYGFEPDDKMRAKEHADTLLALALKMRKGWTPDPIIVMKKGTGYMVLDGHHRMHAARKAGVETLPAVVVDSGNVQFSDEVPEGKMAKAAGAAALAGCIAGTPGCAVTSVKDVARDIQTVGRKAQTVKDMGRAGAEEELYNILRQKLRNVKEGTVDESSIYQALKQKFGVISHREDYDKVAEYLHNEIVQASRGGAPEHGLGYYAQQIAKQFDGIDYRALIDVYKDQYGLEGLEEQTTDVQYSPGERLTDFPEVGDIYGKKDLEAAATPARLHKKPVKKNPSIYSEVATESASGYIPTAKEKRDPRFKTALTVDVKPGETQRQAAKLGMKIDKKGSPPLLHKSAAKNTSANKAYNLGLTESLWAKYKALKESKLEEEELVEISQTPGAIRDWAASDAAQGIIAGFEAEVILPDIGSMDYDDDPEPDFDEDRRVKSIEDVLDFFDFDEHGYGLSSREANDLRQSLLTEYQEWVDESIMNMWEYDEFRRVCEDEGWWEDLVQEELDDLEDNDEIDEEDKQEEAEERAEDRLAKMWSGDSGFYSDALDVFREEKYGDSDLEEEDFFEEVYPFMSDVANQQGLSWPYLVGVAGDAEQWEDLGDNLSQVLGYKVRVSSGYHSMSRGDYYIMEPDSSISPDSGSDSGVEIVSPPMPLAQAQEQLRELVGWLKSNRAYTNDSTGLHMGISLPDADIDYTKLVLFTGDKYMLDQFDRAYNTYARSAFDKLMDQVKYSREPGGNFKKIDIEEAMKMIRKGLATIAGDLVRGRVGDEKYTSIHIKRGYIEFRIAGGNWIDKAEQAELAMLRFARAYSIAADQDAERNEYLQKLYKLASAENPVENIWAQYQAGTISSEELKDAWANRVLGIDPDAGKEDAFGDRTYQVRLKATGDVVKDLYARDAEEAQQAFQNYLRNYPESMHQDYVLVDPTKVSKPVKGRKADVAKRLQQRTRIFKFELTKPDTEDMRARGAALEGVRQALREQETQTFLVPAKDEQSARAKLPYYADWITPRSASRAKIAQVLPAKAENMPQEPEYKNQDFGFQFNLRGETGAGATQTVKISSPNRASAIETLARKVKDQYGIMARIENFKQVDPAKIKDGELQDEPKDLTFKVQVKIRTGDNVEYKILDVKAPNEYMALSKAEEPYKRNNPNSVVSATIADQ